MAQNQGFMTAESLKVLAIAIQSERFSQTLFIAGDTNFAPITSDLVIYEDIFKPFLTAELVLQDDRDILLSLKGSEKVVIILQGPTEETNSIEKTFVIESVELVEHVTDTQSIIKLSLIENFGYYEKLKKINVGYQGTGEEMIIKITQEQVNKDVYTVNSSDRARSEAFTYEFKPSYQQTFRYIVPWLNPFSAISKIISKMTTQDGMPYFYFSTLASDKQILTDLSSIIEKGSFTKGIPFVYSASNNSGTPTLVDMGRMVEAYEAYEISNTLLLARLGAITSRIESINTSTGQTHTSKIEMLTQMKAMEQNGLFDNLLVKSQKMQLFDNITTFLENSEEKLTDLTSDVNYFLETRNVKDENILSFNQSVDLVDARLKIVRSSILRYILMNFVTIKVPGLLFSNKNLRSSVGNILDFAMLRELDEGTIRDTTDTMFDQEKSGQFLILRKKHIIDLTSMPENHTVQLDISKIADLPGYGEF